jgi:hypothetical protein
VDRIEKLLNEIKKDNSIWKDKKGRQTYFSGKFLNDVGDIFEQHGFGVTKTYLINQAGRDRSQALALIRVLEKMADYHEIINHRAIGRYVIKSILTLKKMEV